VASRLHRNGRLRSRGNRAVELEDFEERADRLLRRRPNIPMVMRPIRPENGRNNIADDSIISLDPIVFVREPILPIVNEIRIIEDGNRAEINNNTFTAARRDNSVNIAINSERVHNISV
jgi:hypothetical protein